MPFRLVTLASPLAVMVVGKNILPLFLVGDSPGDIMNGDILGIRISSNPPLPKGEFINVAEVGRPWLVRGNPPTIA